MDIYWLHTPACRDPLRVGGKAAQLGRLAAMHPVPPGFCLAATRSDTNPLPATIQIRLAAAYTRLGQQCGQPRPRVAVRSSAVDEDGHQDSFAGLHETFLNVIGSAAMNAAVQRCIASAETERACRYRRARGLSEQARMAVLIQQLVLADISAVVFSADPCTGDRSKIVINATWGLGESLVGGTVTPDLYVVRKTDLKVLARHVADKTCMTIVRPGGTREVQVPRALRTEPALDDAKTVALARLARTLERSQGWPVDLECAYQRGQIYLLQCRPITTLPAPPVPSSTAPSLCA